MLKSFIKDKEDDVFFYRDSLRRLIIIALILLVVNYCIVAVLLYRQLTIKQPPYFATTSDGRLLTLTPE